jgi:hypothetical protein
MLRGTWQKTVKMSAVKNFSEVGGGGGTARKFEKKKKTVFWLVTPPSLARARSFGGTKHNQY